MFPSSHIHPLGPLQLPTQGFFLDLRFKVSNYTMRFTMHALIKDINLNHFLVVFFEIAPLFLCISVGYVHTIDTLAGMTWQDIIFSMFQAYYMHLCAVALTPCYSISISDGSGVIGIHTGGVIPPLIYAMEHEYIIKTPCYKQKIILGWKHPLFFTRWHTCHRTCVKASCTSIYTVKIGMCFPHKSL